MKQSKRIVITGSQGSLGMILQDGLKDSFDLLCIDKISQNKTFAIDLANEYEKFKDLLNKDDVIIHLAWDMREDFPNENIVQQNKMMAENIYRVAVEKKISRVIIASSVHVNDYSNAMVGEYISPMSENFPDTPYGAGKVYIEHLGRFFSRKYSLEVVCLRFGGVNKYNKIMFNEDPLYDRVLLYKEDLIELVRMCIEVDKVPNNFAAFYAVSNVLGRVHSLDNFLGWRPKFPKN
ncbi:NAD(P)-dependent oxidoreductase [Patescibacteria group bacterium]|nr:NAD(P)-dependent oxidoreductase [Patescibacteria group bacterium]MBU4274638.1 NAD(P)-dependent oxidoreductase [Patescibacteria group bacterium]MBU4367684.1 NAD(P)-dependent oxidoreductase [Patescibacteria group bacterium]MBU4461866.1 NAD(P)-dependent oxidoreductase [Patescibacteria group bacterium]MCG2700003.1 NAD(P)-dependent oxidoreductase [Candidatus Parcubacteria bacterium]